MATKKRSGIALVLALVFCPCHFPFILLGLSFLFFGSLVFSLVTAIVASTVIFLAFFLYGVFHFLRERHFPAPPPAVSARESKGVETQ